MREKIKEIIEEFSPLPERSIAIMERIGEGKINELKEEGLKRFAWITGFSGFLGRFLVRSPDVLRLLEEMEIKSVSRREHMEKMKKGIRGSVEEVLYGLARYKYTELLRIALLEREIVDEKNYWKVLGELSSLYESMILFLYESFYSHVPIYIFALGKLGASEVNLSSDVDLLFIRDDTAEPVESERAVSHLINLISTKREYGFLLRVDTEIRPYGKFGPIVSSVSSAADYYLTRGQVWERYALLRMREITDTKGAEDFRKAVEYFLFRRFLDFTTIDEMAYIKEQVEKETAEKEGEWNLKTGRGGIRELEFFVQTLQLIYGGKFKSLRERGISVLKALRDEGIIKPEIAENLNTAYMFLRKLENTLQWEDELRTHTLNLEKKALLSVIKKMRMDEEEFFGKLEAVRSFVRQLFDDMFRKETEQLEIILTQIPESHQKIIEKSLKELEEKNPADLRMRIRKIFKFLLGELKEGEDSLLSLNTFLNLLSSIKISSYIYYLSESPKVIRLLLKTLKNPFMGTFLSKNPWLLESIIQEEEENEEFSEPLLKKELEKVLAEVSDLEECIESLVRFKNEKTFEILKEDLLRGIPLEEVFFKLSTLADVILWGCMGAARASAEKGDFKTYLQEVDEIPLVLVGMGKYGGMELNYYSDVDMIFIYEREKGFEHEKILRIVQKFISILTTPTPEGSLYRVDTRLRPSGEAGPLVSSMESFEEYHKNLARTWERQALLKARPVTGEKNLRERLKSTVFRYIYKELDREKIRRDMLEMRKKMHLREGGLKRGYNIKFMEGGIVDVEFTVQFLQLIHGLTHPEILSGSTTTAIEKMEKAGLLEKGLSRELKRGYLFFRDIERALRLYHQREEDVIKEEDFPKIISLMKHEVKDAGKEIENMRESIRKCYTKVFYGE